MANRKAFEKLVLDRMGRVTDGGGNKVIYERIFKEATDEQIEGMVKWLEQGNSLPIWSPGGIKKEELRYETLMKLCELDKVKIMQRVISYDEDTNIMSMSPNEAIVGRSELRAQRQFWAKKFNAAKNDYKIDDLTGQVSMESRATGISMPEITVLRGLGLTTMANELYNVKGGDQDALKAYKNDLLTTGKTTTDGSLRKGSGTKVLSTVHYLLRGRLIDNNIPNKAA
jgi:hypothetical protein